MAYTFSTNPARQEYDAFVSSHPAQSLLQSYSWAEVKSNWDHIHTLVKDENGNTVAAGLALIKQLPGGFGLMYLPRGPVMDYKNKELLQFYLNNLKREAKKHRVLFIKLDPPIHVNDYKSQDYNENRYPETKIYLDNFASAGCIHQGFPLKIEDSIQPRFQSVVTDSINYEKNLPRHTRNFIKTAKKVNMQIESGTYEFLDDFARLVSLTEERKGISLRSKEYFKRLLDIYGEDARIFLAKVNIGKLMADLKEELEKLYAEKETLQPNQKKKTHLLLEKIDSVEKKVKMFEELKEQGVPQEECAIAGALSVKYGKTAEMLYAGMDEQFKQFMPQYLEYIENFRWAFDAGCTEFSMGGVEGTLDDGLTKFKDNFAPIINEYIGEFDLPVNKLLYKPSKIAYNKVKNRLH